MHWKAKAHCGLRKTDLDYPLLGRSGKENNSKWVLWRACTVGTFVPTDINHFQMKTNTPAICSKKFRCQNLFLLVAALSISAACSGQKPDNSVDVKGRLLLDEAEPWDGSLTVVEMNNASCVPLELKDDGIFRLSMTVGSKAYLRFERTGYLTKEILVDTKNADKCTTNCSKNEKLRFDVQMTPVLPDRSLRYAGPVGTITFMKGTGLMKVRYDRSLVRTQEGDIVDGTLRK